MTAVLVTGATGGVGRQVVRQLLERGASVRVLTRDPARAGMPDGVEVVQGDLTRPSSLVGAFDGIDRVHLFSVEEAAQEVVAMARAAGVEHIVTLSAAAVTIGVSVNPVEQAVEASGLAWTHVRPAGFMSNMLHVWAPSIRAERVVRYPFPDQSDGYPIHEADIAAVAVAALLEDGHDGRAYTLTGPQEMTYRDQVRAIAEALGEDVRYEEVTREEARELLAAQGGFAAEVADLLLGFVDYNGNEIEADATDGWDESSGDDGPDWSALFRTWPDVERVTGRPPRTYVEWARDHLADFR